MYIFMYIFMYNISYILYTIMKLCSIAWFVLFFSIVGIIVDYSLFGTTSLGILSNVIFTGLFVWWANWACFKQGYNWMAWLIVLFVGFSTMGVIFIYKYRNTDSIVHQAINEEKEFRKKYGL